MSDAFITRRGGAGGGLNFKIVGGTTRPSKPKDNTIWVNTTEEITGWFFSAEEPALPTNGMVWFSTSSSSHVEFNALKKDGIQVYPVTARQYVNGAWHVVPTLSYMEGGWTSWRIYVVENGNQIDFATQARSDSPVKITPSVEYVTLENSANFANGLTTSKKYDLAAGSKIVLDVDVIRANTTASSNAAFKGNSIILLTNTNLSSASALYGAVAAYKLSTVTGRQLIELDVSTDGSYYIGVGLGSSSTQSNCVRIYNFYIM